MIGSCLNIRKLFSFHQERPSILWPARLASLIYHLWAASRPIGLLTTLLIGDALFLLLHLLLVFTPFISDGNFYLDVDGGYGEWFQYLKFGSVIWLLATLIRRQRAPLYVHWLVLFAYFLLDDAFRIHERGGVWLAEVFGLPTFLSLRPQDIGELGVFFFTGLFFLTTLVLAYQLSDHSIRRFSQPLILALLGLLFFGVVVDMRPEMASRPFLHELLIVVEDGSELIVVSIILWLVFKQAKQVNGWLTEQVHQWVQTIAMAAGLFLLFASILGFIQYSISGLAGNDGYYHAKMGLLVRQQGLKPTPPQLPLTILNEASFYDHHLLYHLYLALFAKTDPALDGGLALTRQVKAATVILSALAFVAVWWLLRGQGVRWAAWWALALLALSEAFLYRLSLPRVQAASLLVLVVGLHWLFHARYRLLLPLGFVYVWLYNAFPLLLVLSGVYFIAVALVRRRLVWPAVVYPAAGILAGLLINPYFPRHITFIGQHLLLKLWDAAATPVGSEWYPYDTWTLVQNSGMALGLFVLTLVLLNWRNKRMDAHELTLFFMTAVCGLMLFRARRFIEYFPPFVLMFAALSLSSLAIRWPQKWSAYQRWVPLGFFLLLLLPTIFTLKAAKTSMTESMPANHYAAAALWLGAYSEPGSMVFQTDWDDFTRLFFYDSDNAYTVGLDPTYMSLYDQALYAEWVQITRGDVLRPSAAIRDRFHAAYVFSDLEHEAFLQQAAVDPGLQEVYRDAHAVIFAVTGQGK